MFMLENFFSTTFPENQYLGKSLLLAYTLMSLVLDLTQMVLAVRKPHQLTNIIILDNFGFKTVSKNQSLGMSGLRSSRYLLEAPMVIRMVLAVRKHLQITNMIILDNFGLNNCLKKSIPGDVRAQVPQEPVGASHGDQARKSGILPIFPDPGGRDESNGISHLAIAPTPTFSQGGGRCSNI